MIGIVGAGIGGLTAAVALRRIGLDVEVLERAPDVRPVGAGLTVQVNAMRMLEALDLADAVLGAGQPLEEGWMARADGSRLAGMPLSDGWGQPGVGILRGRLSDILLDALPDEAVQCGVGVEGVSEDGTVVDTDGVERVYDAVVGADGIHSAVRTALFGTVPLRYAGYTCWRGLAEVPSSRMCERLGAGQRFGTVPVGHGMTYWFATTNAAAGGADGPDPVTELCERFAGFEPLVADLVRMTDTVMRHDLFDFVPIHRWTKGRVTLLGDAAHAMTPNLGQGACQAIEDAVVLADAVSRLGVPDGLEAYEVARKARARSFVRQSWRLGTVAQWSNPVACWARDLGMAWTPASVMKRQLAVTYGVDVPELRPAELSGTRRTFVSGAARGCR